MGAGPAAVALSMRESSSRPLLCPGPAPCRLWGCEGGHTGVLPGDRGVLWGSRPTSIQLLARAVKDVDSYRVFSYAVPFYSATPSKAINPVTSGALQGGLNRTPSSCHIWGWRQEVGQAFTGVPFYRGEAHCSFTKLVSPEPFCTALLRSRRDRLPDKCPSVLSLSP